MAASSLTLPSLSSSKTLVVSTTAKTLNPFLSFFSPSLSFRTIINNKPISFSSSSKRSSTFVLPKVALYDQQEEEVSGGGGGERNYSSDLKIFVGNLPFTVDSAEVAELFEKVGTVEQVEVIYDKQTGRSRGFGFVVMSTAEDVEAAVQKFNGYELDGRALRVNSGPPPPRDETSSFNRGARVGGGGGGGSYDNSNRVYVGNLSWGVDDHALENLFREQGRVLEAKVVYDRESGRSRGFGFVTYSSSEEVNNAISSLNGVDLDGRDIRVTMAEARPPRRQF